MNRKAILIFFSLTCLLVNTLIISLNSDSCFFLALGHINAVPTFNYTISKTWTAEEAFLLKNGSLNASDFIHVSGWEPYVAPIAFFSKVAKKGQSIMRSLKPIKDILHGSDAPQFSLSDADLQLAFGRPSQARLYTVPMGKALIVLRHQVSVPGVPHVGKWSVLIDLINQDQFIEQEMHIIAQRLKQLILRFNLTPKEVAAALNIIPPFIQNSLFWSFSDSPLAGSIAAVDYEAFLMVIRGGEEFLGGPINEGQPHVIQVKDVVQDRTQCN